MQVKENQSVDINPALKPVSVHYILEKLYGKQLNYDKIYEIIADITKNKLTEAEIAYFVSAELLRGMSLREVSYLTQSIVRNGLQLKFPNRFVLDKHSIGGLPGNRTTPIVVSIVAAAIDKYQLDACFPKTSSRAITSPAGTADVIECLAKVEFNVKEVMKLIERVGACLIWGGALQLAPADDKIIQVERLLGIDPDSQLLASILAKKLAVGATHLVIDIPTGKYAKADKERAIKLKNSFLTLCRWFNIRVSILTTPGNEPVGFGLGPVLEARDVIAVLKQEKNRPLDLETRAIRLATELIRIARISRDPKEAELILKQGKAFEKFAEIMKAQHGSADKKLKTASHKEIIKAKRTGKIREINSRLLSDLARQLGCPADKGAGIELHAKLNDSVKQGQALCTFYAETEQKLDWALRFIEKRELFRIS